ncbi:MAG: hypothetical protein ACI9MC_001850 [Kiritimatiellia bacterium]|jgi:hypothetical protein
MLFRHSTGTSWRTNKSRPVRSEVGSGSIVCHLQAGQIVPVHEQPTRTNGSRWLPVYGDVRQD